MKSIINALDKPGIRWLTAAGASVAETFVRGQPVLVRPLAGGAFLHRHVDGVIILAEVLSEMTPARQERVTRDICCYEYTPQPGDTVLDIGAGYGEETLTFSRLVGPLGRVISIEAHPDTYRRLKLTCKYNHLANVTPLQLAVTDAETTVILNEGGPEDGGYKATTIDGMGQIAVPGTTIDEIIFTHGCERVDLLKMNIEGAEQLAIRGMKHSLGRVRHVVISCHDFIWQAGLPGATREWFATYETITAFLRDAGFTLAKQRLNDSRPWVRFHVYGTHEIG